MDLSKWTVCTHVKSLDVVVVLPTREHAEKLIEDTKVEINIGNPTTLGPLYAICDDSEITTKVFTIMSYAMSGKGKKLNNGTVIYGYRNYEVRDVKDTNYYSIYGSKIGTNYPINP